MHDHESPDFGLTDPELAAFEARLASLAPQSLIDRDQIMFSAGRRTTGRHLRTINRVLAGTSLALVGLLYLPLFSRDAGQPVTIPAVSLAARQSSVASPKPPLTKRPDGGSDELSVALAQGPTSQQLLRLWEKNGQSFDRPVDRLSDDAPVPRDDFAPTSSSTSRELLLHYLRSAHERL